MNSNSSFENKLVPRAVFAAGTLALAISLSGCGPDSNANTAVAPPPPSVSVAQVVQKEIIDWDEYTGRLEAAKTVELRPRVSGYVESVHFREGAIVKQGQLLFQIDPRPFRAEFDRAQAEEERARSQQSRAKSDLARAQRLLSNRAISQEEFDQRASALQEADATVNAAAAALTAARLNLEFTGVTAPITGRIGRAQVVEGNLVAGGATNSTLLTTLVSLDPVYAYFDADERSFVDYARSTRAAKEKMSAYFGLPSEQGYPHEGRLDFIDNHVNPQTGTLRLRAVFRDPDGEFTPGLFVRLKLPGSGKYNALLINERAIGTDQGNKFVLAVNEQNQVQFRPVKLGPVTDGLRVVREGLNPGERIVVNGLQRVRPGMPVTPETVSMLTLAAEGNTTAPLPSAEAEK
ncbi:MAG: efflux RND transporter periplasmic adaptor subunit [Gammaproteobacteria bacterium]|nr:efflux RND transporter periplasmic adaptor subunit [Gammaproteobacteria bacterium]